MNANVRYTATKTTWYHRNFNLALKSKENEDDNGKPNAYAMDERRRKKTDSNDDDDDDNERK